MNVPRIEISPPGVADYDQQKQQFNIQTSISSVDPPRYTYNDGFYPSWQNHIGPRSMNDRLGIGSPHNSYYSSPDVSPMGSRNSSYSELDGIGKTCTDYINRPSYNYEGGHSDSEFINDNKGKKRKISMRQRSDSCFDPFSLRGQLAWMIPSWIRAHPEKYGNIEIKITRQPINHRAQYIGEGSRGPIRSQKGYPAIKITNFKGTGVVRLYLATEDSPLCYHPFYQICKVMTKTGPQMTSTETIIDKVKVIQIPFHCDERKSKVLEISIAGILKLKNSQVEAALGDYGVVQPRSTRVRLVVMANLVDETHKELTLQTISDPIFCNQVSSEPVILKCSIYEDYAAGGAELWVIGKHFRHIRVIFTEKNGGQVTWEAEAVVNKGFLASNHLVCIVPQYINQAIDAPANVEIQLITQYKDQLRYSPPKEFKYLPNKCNTSFKQECDSNEVITSVGKMDLKDKTLLKEIGKTDSFDRMITALKHSVDQHLSQQQRSFDTQGEHTWENQQELFN